MKYFAVPLLFASAMAQAHVTPGVYSGVTGTGEKCTMKAGATTFVDGMRHPLSERVEIEVGNGKFSVAHPSSVDTQKTAIVFNHDEFQAIVPHSEGAKALTVTMVHSEKYEGPSAYALIDDNWSKRTKVALHCTKLVLTEPASK